MRLMISVTSAQEAREALAAGAQILDVKNPREGSLGAQPPHLLREIVDFAAQRVEVGAAIGDMPNLPGTAALAALGAACCGVTYVKVGLYRSGVRADAVRLLKAVQAAVRETGVQVIAASYADFLRVGALDPAELPAAAMEAGVRGCLLDTAIKDGRRLFDLIDRGLLEQLVGEAHAAGQLFGIAGSLQAQDLPQAQMIGADVVGLRTAVCKNGDRVSPLDPALVRRIIRTIRTIG